jgi:hypothetical protein
LTPKASAPAAANTFTAPTTDRVPQLPTATVKKAVAAVTQVGKSSGGAGRAGTAIPGALNDPPTLAKKPVAAATRVGKSTGDVDGTVAKAGGTAAQGADTTAGTDVKHAGVGSVGKHVK